MVFLFTITVFLSAGLLFSVQPMVAKTLLPIFGGGSSVWTTCMLFYQTVLLIGYLYAHVLLTRFSKRAQIGIHAVVLVSALVVGVMIDTPVAPSAGSDFPVPWLLGQLALVSGLPFFAISSAGPLIQGWFSKTGHTRAHDPYFLYAASNAGSLIGLLAYPFVIEPGLGLDEQRHWWLIGLGVFAVMALWGASLTRSANAKGSEKIKAKGKVDEQAVEEQVTWKRRGLWVFLAFVPSSMLLGVTSFITTDVASFPLLWVIPLALYLVTMIIAFAANAEKLVKDAARPMLVAVIASLVLLILGQQSGAGAPLIWVLLIQLLLLTVVGVYAHGRLAADRPHAGRLTEFYLMMSIGGALGGVFNGFVAPLVFPDAYEYHLALIAAVATIPALADAKKRLRMRWTMPLVTVVYLGFVFLFRKYADVIVPGWSDNEMLAQGAILGLLIAGPSVLMYMSWRDGIACSLTLAALLIAVIVQDLSNPLVIHRSRTFYGLHTVINRLDFYEDQVVQVHKLKHGTTSHGMQIVGAEFRKLPLSYYHNDGPVGKYFIRLIEADPKARRMAFIGLGSGAMAAYGRPGDEITFFEIDPEIVRIAQDPELFTFLADSQAEIDIVIGDGRLNLDRSEQSGEPEFDVVLVDAFSSDAIPMHLLTVEAMELYFERLTTDGVLVLHISNRHLELAPVCYALGEAVGAYTLLGREILDAEVSERTNRESSVWVVMTRDRPSAELALKAGFRVIAGDEEPMDPWTDQSSNILEVFLFE